MKYEREFYINENEELACELTGLALTIVMVRGMAIAGYDALRQKLQTKSKNITEKFSDKFQKNSDS